jgi:cysteine synthase A
MTIPVSSDILQQIGNTPLIRLGRFETAHSAAIYAKLETVNPGGSIKDRICMGMIRRAEAEGLLKPGGTVIEPTSGNTGIGLSLVCAVMGYRLVLTMPDSMSVERRRLLAAYGAELVLTPGSQGMRGAVQRAEELAAANDYYLPNQFENSANPEAHRISTGPEIIEGMGGKSVDAFVCGVGTGGTLTGVGEALRARNPGVRLVAVEPASSAVLSGGQPGSHKIQGIGAGFVPPVLQMDMVDEVVAVTDEEAAHTTRRLAQVAGFLLGISSGANVRAAQQVAENLGPDKNVVTVLCDTGERYLSTGMFD